MASSLQGRVDGMTVPREITRGIPALFGAKAGSGVPNGRNWERSSWSAASCSTICLFSQSATRVVIFPLLQQKEQLLCSPGLQKRSGAADWGWRQSRAARFPWAERRARPLLGACGREMTPELPHAVPELSDSVLVAQ